MRYYFQMFACDRDESPSSVICAKHNDLMVSLGRGT